MMNKLNKATKIELWRCILKMNTFSQNPYDDVKDEDFNYRVRQTSMKQYLSILKANTKEMLEYIILNMVSCAESVLSVVCYDDDGTFIEECSDIWNRGRKIAEEMESLCKMLEVKS